MADNAKLEGGWGGGGVGWCVCVAGGNDQK